MTSSTLWFWISVSIWKFVLLQCGLARQNEGFRDFDFTLTLFHWRICDPWRGK